MKTNPNWIAHPFILLVWLAIPVQASENFSWHGFVSQGIIQAEHSNYIEHDGDVSFRLTEVGLNGAYKLNTNFRVAGQAVYLNGGNRYPEGARIDYLFIDWSALRTLDWQVNIHAGRVKNYHWYYSATRDVPHTRPTIILPQSVYFDSFRDVALGVDGVAIVSNLSNQYGDWEVNWSYGKSSISGEQTKNLLGSPATGMLEQDFVHQLNLVWYNQTLRFGAGLLDSEFNYQQGPSDWFIDGEAQVQRLMLQGTYETQSWQFVAELFKERTIYDNLIFTNFNSDTISDGGYLQARYLASPTLSYTARLDMIDLDREDRDGRIRELTSGGQIPAYFGFQDQFTLGVSWKIKPQWRIQAEFHRVKGTGRLAPVLLPNTVSNDRKYWNMWGVQLIHWF